MVPIQLTIKDIPESPALEDHIRKRAEKLQQYYKRITSCRVVIELPKKHQHHGKLFNAKIDVTVPGKEFVATHQDDKDVYVAVRDAFDAITRQLEEHNKRLQAKDKDR
jgi:ribosomal subunit interface protein